MCLLFVFVCCVVLILLMVVYDWILDSNGYMYLLDLLACVCLCLMFPHLCCLRGC